MKKLLFIFAASLMFVSNVNAQEETDASSGNVPRMVSIRSSRVNARSGPGMRYPIEWNYMQINAPVEIVAEFELWRKIKDWQGSESWVHKSMLASRRTVKITNPGENNIYLKPDYESKVIAKVEDEVVGDVKKCPHDSQFCLLKFGNIEGWVSKNNFFGVYPDEVID